MFNCCAVPEIRSRLRRSVTDCVNSCNYTVVADVAL